MKVNVDSPPLLGDESVAGSSLPADQGSSHPD